jgi:hypothetical protein
LHEEERPENVKDLAFAWEKSEILKELPDAKGDMCPAAEECAETPFFGELRTNSKAKAVLKLSTDHVEVGERWVDGAGSLRTWLVSGVRLVDRFKLVTSIRGVHVDIGVGVGGVVALALALALTVLWWWKWWVTQGSMVDRVWCRPTMRLL